MRGAASLKYALLLGFGVVACAVASCQGNGVTSICPSLPRDRDSQLANRAGAAGADADAFARAVDAGCVTAPTSFASDGGASDGGASGSTSTSDNDHDVGAGGSSAGAAGHV